jgi:pantoate--beta-alanine ligase
MSSRNTYLQPNEREAALVLNRSLMKAREMYVSGERDAERIRRAMRDLIEAEPLARIDYVSVANATDLSELDTIGQDAAGKRILISLAVRIGRTRLIDNTVIE